MGKRVHSYAQAPKCDSPSSNLGLSAIGQRIFMRTILEVASVSRYSARRVAGVER
jgi:hypothetical protein